MTRTFATGDSNNLMSGRARYQPRLSVLMNLCETNYMLLLKLLADKEQVGEQRCFFYFGFYLLFGKG